MRYTNYLRRGPGDTFLSMKNSSKNAISTGLALSKHVNSQHNGVIQEDCPACKDIQRKAEAMHEKLDTAC